MNTREVSAVCRTFPGATEQVMWEDDLVFKVGGKMFAAMGLGDDSPFAFKCPEPLFYEMSRLPGFRPAPYLARAHWVQVDPARCTLHASDLAGMLRQSYDLVFSRLPKKIRQLIENGEEQK